MPPEVRAVFTTAPDRSLAERLVHTVVEERLAACGTVLGGAVSIYRWEEDVVRAEEVMVILKTTRASVDLLKDRIVALHPYDVPEVLVLDVADGHQPYLDWVGRESIQR